MMHLNDTTGCVKGQHLTLHERIEIQTYKHLKYSNRFIAKALGRSHSTINDEIKRGTTVQKKLVNGNPIFHEAYYAETAGGKMNLQMHGKEFFQTSVSTFF